MMGNIKFWDLDNIETFFGYSILHENYDGIIYERHFDLCIWWYLIT